MTVAVNRSTTRASGPSSAMLIWLGLALLALAGGWLLLNAWKEGLSGGRDFVQDYAAVLKIGQGRSPYEPYNDVIGQLFGNPPRRASIYSFHAPSSLPLLIWLLPFAKLGDYAGAYLAWGFVSLLAFWAVCWLTLDALKLPRPVVAGGLAALALITLPAVRESFEEGQLNVVIAAGMVGCWAARRHGRSGLAGVLLGAAFALKPIPGLFFLYYAWRRDWRLLAAAAATLVVLSLVGVMLSGISGAWVWATVAYPAHANYWPGYPDNASVRGFFSRIFEASEWTRRPPLPLPYAATLLWATSGGLLTLAALAVAGASVRSPVPPVARDESRADLEIAVLTILTLLVTPIVWPHYYVVLAMPVGVIAIYLGRLVLDGSVKSAADQDAAYNRRRRVIPTIGLVILATSTAVLSTAHYVEPFRGVGGQQLLALLALFGAALIALGWSVRAQERGVSPARAR